MLYTEDYHLRVVIPLMAQADEPTHYAGSGTPQVLAYAVSAGSGGACFRSAESPQVGLPAEAVLSYDIYPTTGQVTGIGVAVQGGAFRDDLLECGAAFPTPYFAVGSTLLEGLLDDSPVGISGWSYRGGELWAFAQHSASGSFGGGDSWSEKVTLEIHEVSGSGQ